MNLSPINSPAGIENHQWLRSARDLEDAVSIALDPSTFTSGTHYPNGVLLSGTPLGKITASGKYGPYVADTSEVQTVTITGSPTGGTVTLTFDGETTAAIAYNAAAATVQAGLSWIRSDEATSGPTTAGCPRATAGAVLAVVPRRGLGHR